MFLCLGHQYFGKQTTPASDC